MFPACQSLWTLDYQVITLFVQFIYSIYYIYSLSAKRMTIWVKTELFSSLGFPLQWNFVDFFLGSDIWNLESCGPWECKVIIIFCFWQTKLRIQLNFSSRQILTESSQNMKQKKNRRWKTEHSEQQSQTICLIEADLLVSHHRARILRQRNRRNWKENNLDFLF